MREQVVTLASTKMYRCGVLRMTTVMVGLVLVGCSGKTATLTFQRTVFSESELRDDAHTAFARDPSALATICSNGERVPADVFVTQISKTATPPLDETDVAAVNRGAEIFHEECRMQFGAAQR